MSYQARYIKEDHYIFGDEEYGHSLTSVHFIEDDDLLSDEVKQNLVRDFGEAILKARKSVALQLLKIPPPLEG